MLVHVEVGVGKGGSLVKESGRMTWECIIGSFRISKRCFSFSFFFFYLNSDYKTKKNYVSNDLFLFGHPSLVKVSKVMGYTT